MANSEISNTTDLQPLLETIQVLPDTNILPYSFVTPFPASDDQLYAVPLKINKMVYNFGMDLSEFRNSPTLVGVSPYKYYTWENSTLSFKFVVIAYSSGLGATPRRLIEIDFLFDFPMAQSMTAGDESGVPNKVIEFDNASTLVINTKMGGGVNQVLNFQWSFDLPIYWTNKPAQNDSKSFFGMIVEVENVSPLNTTPLFGRIMEHKLWGEFFNNSQTK